jgi:hypothetical protein
LAVDGAIQLLTMQIAKFDAVPEFEVPAEDVVLTDA